jgi:hypothetical protein
MSRGAGRHLLVGGICGLAWSSGLRGWMAQLADGMPNSHSEVTWLTLVLVLLPGTLIGALLAYSAYLGAAGRPGSRWLVFSPGLFATALLDPKIFVGLVRNGTGAGSLVVIATALSVAYAVSRPSWSVTRALVAAIGAVGLLVIFGMGGMAAPLATPRGAWVSLYGSSLVLLLGVASALPYRSLPVHPSAFDDRRLLPKGCESRHGRSDMPLRRRSHTPSLSATDKVSDTLGTRSVPSATASGSRQRWRGAGFEPATSG